MMRYTLYYLNHHGKEDWMDAWLPSRESVSFKTLKEAMEYLSIMEERDKAYIIDNVTKKKIGS